MANSYKNDQPLPALLNMSKRAKIYRHIVRDIFFTKISPKKSMLIHFDLRKKFLLPKSIQLKYRYVIPTIFLKKKSKFYRIH